MNKILFAFLNLIFICTQVQAQITDTTWQMHLSEGVVNLIGKKIESRATLLYLEVITLDRLNGTIDTVWENTTGISYRLYENRLSPYARVDEKEFNFFLLENDKCGFVLWNWNLGTIEFFSLRFLNDKQWHLIGIHKIRFTVDSSDIPAVGLLSPVTMRFNDRYRRNPTKLFHINFVGQVEVYEQRTILERDTSIAKRPNNLLYFNSKEDK